MTAPALISAPEDEDTARARAAVDGYTWQWGSFADLLDERADDPRVALVWTGDERREWSGRDWVEHSRRVAHLMQEHGVAEGDEIVVIADNQPATLLIAFAAWIIGAAFVPLNPGDAPGRLVEIVSECVSPVVIGDPEGAVPGARSLGLATITPTPSTPIEARKPRAGLDAIALRMHTSGTSGTPKPILISMRSLLLDCDAMQTAFGWNDDTRTLTVLPISHANGLVISSFLPWFTGGSSVLVDRFSVQRFWPLVRDERITACSLVPTHLEYLVAHEGSIGDTGRLREVFSGSGPLRPETANSFEDRYGVPVRQLYGLSETSAVVTATPLVEVGDLTDHWRDSIGAALPHTDLDVLDPEGDSCPESISGELVVRSEVLMLGYAGRDRATQEAFAGGWFHTGDRASWRTGPDGRRWYFLDGRLTDVIARAGNTVLPHTLDATIAGYPGLVQAVVFGFPHRWYGEEVAVAVVPADTFDSETFLNWCESRFGHDNAPKVAVVVDTIPATAVGKVRRGLLAEHLRSRLSKYWDTRFPRRKNESADTLTTNRRKP